MAECIDLPKAYKNVYGIGVGTTMDQEILVYMKARGWPEKVQVSLFPVIDFSN